MALTVTPPAWGRSSAARRRWGGGQSRQRAAGRPARWSDLWFAAVFEP
ncbi:hypothetical protein I552_3758 [Mycobacterium xenopi 3993]|nr:hypothetical protein I552_3758 [Mycobacterium xenopi 3993]